MNDPPAEAPPPQAVGATSAAEGEPPRRWIAVAIVILAMVGAAGAKAGAKRSKR